MSAERFLAMANADPVPRGEIPLFEIGHLRAAVLQAVEAGHRLAALFGRPAGAGEIEVLAILADDLNGTLSAGAARVEKRYPALTPGCLQAHWFERELAEQWAITPEGHPWLKPIRFHAPHCPGNAPPPRAAAAAPAQPGITDYFRVEGEEVHEVAVGPVHAGIIEPGHFRFQCHGEKVFHLEIELGYQHRGIEQHLRGGPGKKTIHYMETAAGDTTVGHAMAYCHMLEALGGVRVPARAHVLRGIALELERLANHTGDLGALAGDIGFLPTASFCGRIRGDWLNLTAALCGNRFGRGLVRPGGAGCDLDAPGVEQFKRRLDALERDLAGAVDLLWSVSSVMARFEETGHVSREIAEAIGLVGPAARACGIERDVRHDFPSGIFRYSYIPLSTWQSGDVFARAFVRWTECRHSMAFIREQLELLPGGDVAAPFDGRLEPDSLVVSMVEGWRGEICHAALTDSGGRFEQYKIVDPSFHNWFGLAMALRNQQISDFPLCNKSFNLSYCGHDL